MRERRKFRLTIDPHQCAFGKWYDAFYTDDLRLAGQLIKFDSPTSAFTPWAIRWKC